MQISPGAPASPGQPSNALGRQNPSPFSHSICGKARPKTSVAVDAARGDAHAPAEPRTLAIATVRRQREPCAPRRCSEQPHCEGSRVKSTARGAAAYIYSSHIEGAAPSNDGLHQFEG